MNNNTLLEIKYIIKEMKMAISILEKGKPLILNDMLSLDVVTSVHDQCLFIYTVYEKKTSDIHIFLPKFSVVSQESLHKLIS